ncbi:MAG TPA: hypothetical protein ENF30_01735 [Candidatus Desulfofervidus auxilii]|uniref:MotA/TolQ/ExbB proton channel domain-containing protein n=1 Tax=Desulfofervidus auxilii TaxID=1621989 RepID=A0A7V0IAA9_DESA2|nr:hypothetical protein [Candidatus Desulfofervidus auxilii]
MRGTLAFVGTILFFLILFFTGFLGYYCLEYKWGLFSLALKTLIGLFVLLYQKIGIVIVGLIPLTGYVVFMSFLVVLEFLGLFCFEKSPENKMDFVIKMGPMLGVLGTMISLSQAMSHIDMSHGVQAAINQMSSLVGQALNSSVWGVLVAMAAYVINFLTKGRER